MQSNYELLGKYIRQVDERNTFCNDYKLLGVSIEKRFLPSIANTIGTDFSKYKIVRQGQFAYGPVTSRNGDKISVALLEEQNCLISSSYTAFEVIDKELLAPEYLMLWFKRPEFDRYARFKSHGSAREIFDWEQMCAVELRIPNIEEQRKVLSIIQVIQKRIAVLNQLNNYLSECALALFNQASPQANEPNAVLSDIAEITMGQSPSGSSYNEVGNGEVFYQGRGEFGTVFPRRRLFTTEPKRMAQEGDTLMSVRAPVGDLNVANEKCCIGRGLAAIHSNNYQSFIHYLMLGQARQLNAFNGDGTVFGSINGKALKGLPIFLPNADVVSLLETKLAPVDALIRKNDDETRSLEQLRDALLPKLMTCEIDVSKVDVTPLNNHLSTL